MPCVAPGVHKVHKDRGIPCSCLLPSLKCSQRPWKILDLLGGNTKLPHVSKKCLQLI